MIKFRHLATTFGLTAALLAPATAAQADVSDRDADFLRAAHQVNLAEIAAGRLAFTKSADRGVKDLAVMFMRDHIRLDAELTQVARQLRVFLPAVPNEEQQSLARGYAAAGADTFDEYFVTTQLAAHREALTMVRAAAAEADDSAVRDLAAGAAPVVERHHEQLHAEAVEEGIAGYTGHGGRS
ncbi:hypothetical protein ACTI_76690 [Actinoplanes sp. OR16]|uniref:DUF4142 domain-containing protein n=1 Tax=Actinoplanes sp. OR16 TaxID=946334 RepID=UPI000F6E79CE|nr:DUF4142 domain-containing protein [Actinoplanes sp. OR16]BBH70984.1 hypothetical protein ACTI_76690 [Actinoplanes sp. OR16]